MTRRPPRARRAVTVAAVLAVPTVMMSISCRSDTLSFAQPHPTDGLRFDHGGTAMAGAARVEITPPLGTAVGVGCRPMTAVLGPIYARAVYLELPTTACRPAARAVVLVSCDLPFVPLGLRDRVLSGLAGLAGGPTRSDGLELSPDQLVIAATGNPNAPSRYATSVAVVDPPWADGRFDGPCFERLATTIEQAVRAAAATRRPAVFAAGSAVLDRLPPSTRPTNCPAPFALRNVRASRLAADRDATRVLDASAAVVGGLRPRGGDTAPVPWSRRAVDPRCDVLWVSRVAPDDVTADGTVVAALAFLPYRESAPALPLPACAPSAMGAAAAVVEAAIGGAGPLPRPPACGSVPPPVVAVFESAGDDVRLTVDGKTADAATAVAETLAGAILSTARAPTAGPLGVDAAHPSITATAAFSSTGQPASGPSPDGSDANGVPTAAPLETVRVGATTIAVVPGHLDVATGDQIRRAVTGIAEPRPIVLANAAGDLGEFAVPRPAPADPGAPVARRLVEAFCKLARTGGAVRPAAGVPVYRTGIGAGPEVRPTCSADADAAAASWLAPLWQGRAMQRWDFALPKVDPPKVPIVTVEEVSPDPDIRRPRPPWQNWVTVDDGDLPNRFCVLTGVDGTSNHWRAYWLPTGNTSVNRYDFYRFQADGRDGSAARSDSFNLCDPRPGIRTCPPADCGPQPSQPGHGAGLAETQSSSPATE